MHTISHTPGLEFRRDLDLGRGLTIPEHGLAPGARQEQVEFGPLGFADAAIASYDDFKRLRAAGKIPANVRMQVCLPTPLMIELCFTAPEDVLELWPAYERAMLRELDQILAVVPHNELAIQWDMSAEITSILEKCTPALAAIISRDQLVGAGARVTDAVPSAVDVGWHLCYGDLGHSKDRETIHRIEPRDMGIMVGFANALCAAVKRPVNWVHMPVPRERHDLAYFAPLKDLTRGSDTELYLGLVHHTDGVEGTRVRMAAADRVLSRGYGIATECGWGRREPGTIAALMDIHARCAMM